jgi:opacity protein-like surface antigen
MFTVPLYIKKKDYKMKKIISALALTACTLSAAPYIGASIGYSSMAANQNLKGSDTSVNKQLPFDMKEKARLSHVTFGLLGGWNFTLNPKMSLLLEADFEVGSKKSTKKEIDPTANGYLDNLEISVSKKHGFGLMPAIAFNVTDKFSALFGLRLNMTQYRVTVSDHKAAPHNAASKKAYVFGWEPTLGGKFAFNDKISARLTVGYNIGQKKTMHSNFINKQVQVADHVSAGIAVKPRGVNVRAAMIYSF